MLDIYRQSKVKYIGPSCGRHVEEPNDLRVLLTAVALGLTTFILGVLLIWVAFAMF